MLLHEPDHECVKEASKRGVFAHITDDDVEDWQSSIDITLRRFSEYHDLEGAFGRRAMIERAKGILMERHSINERDAFEMLREQSRVDLANSSTLPLPSSAVTVYSPGTGTLPTSRDFGPRGYRPVPPPASAPASSSSRRFASPSS